jgi:hypothetical protein
LASRYASDARMSRLESVELSDAELKLLSETDLVARLVAGGVSRLTAERFVEIQRGNADSGRARPHAMSRH